MKAFSPLQAHVGGSTHPTTPATSVPNRHALSPSSLSSAENVFPEQRVGGQSVSQSPRGLPMRASTSGGIYVMPVSSSTVLLTLNQLSVMSQNGVEIAEAVGHATEHCQDPRLSASLEGIYMALNSGSTFSNAVAMYGHYFPASLPAMLAAAESTGDVPQTLGSVCERMRGEMEMRASIIGAMIYPVILIAAAVAVMTALILGVLPQFGRVFESTGKPIPASTQFLLDVGAMGRQYWMYLLPLVVATLTVMILLRRHPMIRGPIGNILLYGPVIKDAYRPLIAGRIFRTIAAMVRGGVPLLQAVRLTRNTVQNRPWNELLGRVEANLIDGLRASEAMAASDFLPSEATQMMATGERTGRIAEVLDDIGRFYEQEGGRKIKRLVVAMEPVIILLMGVVVAGVVMSVMLPLLDVSTIQSG